MKEIFDQYHKGELSPESRADFESRLQSDPTFRSEYEIYCLAVEAIETGGDENLRTQLEDIHEELFKEDLKIKKPTLLQRNPIIYAAAAIILLIGLYAVFTLTGSISNQDLYAEHFEIMELVSNSRSGDNTALLTFKNEYLSGNYREALTSLSDVEESSQPLYLTELYRGVCLQKIQPPEWDKSIESLNVVLGSDNDFHAHAKWYIAMAYLGSDQSNKAKPIFQELLETGFKVDAIESILKEI